MEERGEQKQEEQPKRNTWRRVILALGVVGLIVAIIKGGFWFHYRFTHATTDDAFVEADLVNVSPLVPGHIAQILKEVIQAIALAKAQMDAARAKLQQVERYYQRYKALYKR